MNDLTRFIKPLAATVAGLLLLAGGYLGYNRFGGGDATYQVTAYFTKAIGLFPNSDVDILGVPIGKVDSVEPMGSRVKVVMNIDNEYKLPADAFAQIVPISVISDRYVQLAPVYKGGPTLEDGAEIPVENTYIPAELDDVFKQLKKLLDAIEPGRRGDPGALGDLIVQLDETLADREEDLKGTLITGSKLTSTLADAQDDISGLLVNLDDLFSQLATRAGSFGTLNRNFALVMAALAESRQDLEGTLVNVGSLTGEVDRLVRTNGDRLGRDVGIAAKILGKVLENRASVEESLRWLPVVGKGFTAAYNPAHQDIDVRDNLNSKLECELFDALPAGPLQEALKEVCRELTGEPPLRTSVDAPGPVMPQRSLARKLDCDQGVRKVQRQVRRLERVSLPEEVLEEVLDPLRKQLKRLKKKCREMGEEIEEQGLLDRLEEGIGGAPDLDEALDGVDDLTGNAAVQPIPDTEGPSVWSRFASWMRGFSSYLGVSS